MRYVLNSAVLTAPGLFRYRLITPDHARAWLQAGPYDSRVGYPETARYIEQSLGAPCPLSREPISMAPGDEALVVRLTYRLQDPGVKGQPLNPSPQDWELGILERLE